MRPDRHALVEMPHKDGYDTVELVTAPSGMATKYFDSSKKSLLVA